MKYVYVVSESERYVSIIDLSDKTVISLCQYDEGDFDYGQSLTWNEKDSRDFLEYSSIEDILQHIDYEKDIIFISDLTIAEMYLRLDNSNYSDWNSSWESCFNVLKQTYNHCYDICIEGLFLMMQQ